MGKLKTFAIASVLLLITAVSSFGEIAKLTAYNENERDSQPYGALNCQSQRLEVGQCAADLRYHQLGEKIYIQDMGVFIVSDCGSKIKGPNRYDIYVSSMKAVREFGVKYKEVKTVKQKTDNKEMYTILNKYKPFACYSSKRINEHSIRSTQIELACN